MVQRHIPPEQQFAETFLKKLREIKKVEQQKVLDGFVEDYSDYRFFMGELNVLNQIEDEYIKTLKAFFNTEVPYED